MTLTSDPGRPSERIGLSNPTLRQQYCHVAILRGNVVSFNHFVTGEGWQQIDRLLTWQVHLLGLLVSIILLVAFPCQLSGPILTGSITWPSFTDGARLTDIVVTQATGPIEV